MKMKTKRSKKKNRRRKRTNTSVVRCAERGYHTHASHRAEGRTDLREGEGVVGEVGVVDERVAREGARQQLHAPQRQAVRGKHLAAIRGERTSERATNAGSAGQGRHGTHVGRQAQRQRRIQAREQTDPTDREATTHAGVYACVECATRARAEVFCVERENPGERAQKRHTRAH